MAKAEEPVTLAKVMAMVGAPNTAVVLVVVVVVPPFLTTLMRSTGAEVRSLAQAEVVEQWPGRVFLLTHYHRH